MNTKISFLAFVFFSLSMSVFAQKATVQGIITDGNNQPIEGVTVKSEVVATTSAKDGSYSVEVPANEATAIYFTHIAYSPKALKINLKNGETLKFNTVFEAANELQEVTIVDQRDREEGIVKLQPATIRNLASANAGVEGLLKLLGGVNSNNELSTAYSVRGGNYDENLVYVNEIEVYRPFLIRSGQQEGLSFTNTDMVEKVDFSAGGFQAKYGDKLSSVLDITYRRPTNFGASAQASFLGGSVAVEAASKDQKWSSITGVRYRDNSLLVNSQQTESNFHPTFADVQTYLTYAPANKWKISFLGNISQNKYNYEPLTRQTNFGTIDEPIALQIFYEGQEKDKYTTYFGALKTEYDVNESFKLKLIGSAYHTQEQEYFDILAQYRLGEVNTNIGSDDYGDVEFTEGIGSQFNHARNDLDALIINAEIKGEHKLKNKHEVEWGVKYTREDFRDRLVEWEVIDSAGFSINPPRVLTHNTQPYTPYTGPLVPYQNVRATNFVTIDRFSAYAQLSHRALWGTNDVYMNVGTRLQNWRVSGEGISQSNQTVVSPRAQFTIKPAWKKDMLFRLSGGYYYQPPFYRELRDADGVVNPDVKAQRSIHVVLANDFSFKMWDNRPFKLVTELYYKDMTDVNAYTLDNVRIRYMADNNA
ncbi:MAG: TonB-dependent receptor, partial [Chitinophagaceae bacterium]